MTLTGNPTVDAAAALTKFVFCGILAGTYLAFRSMRDGKIIEASVWLCIVVVMAL